MPTSTTSAISCGVDGDEKPHPPEFSAPGMIDSQQIERTSEFTGGLSRSLESADSPTLPEPAQLHNGLDPFRDDIEIQRLRREIVFQQRP